MNQMRPRLYSMRSIIFIERNAEKQNKKAPQRAENHITKLEPFEKLPASSLLLNKCHFPCINLF